jgi:hypothetical protein
MAKKDSKFVAQLSRENKQIKIDRARRIGEACSDAQMKLVMDVKSKIRSKQNRLDEMTDLSADNQSTTTNLISKNFDADAFVLEINNLKVDIANLEVELEVAEETSNEWFNITE